MQTEKAKSSHFDRTRGDKNQIFPTLISIETYAPQFIGHNNFFLGSVCCFSVRPTYYTTLNNHCSGNRFKGQHYIEGSKNSRNQSLER